MSTNGLISGMLLTFITAMRALSLIILLLSPSNMVLTGLIFNYNEQDMTQHSGAVTLLLVMIIVGVNVLVRVLSGGAGLSGLRNTGLRPWGDPGAAHRRPSRPSLPPWRWPTRMPESHEGQRPCMPHRQTHGNTRPPCITITKTLAKGEPSTHG